MKIKFEFLRVFIITAFVFILFFLTGFYLLNTINRTVQEPFRDQGPLVFAHLLTTQRQEQVAAIKILQKNYSDFFLQFDLYDEKGDSLVTQTSQLNQWGPLGDWPQADYEVYKKDKKNSGPQDSLIRLPGLPLRYLAVHFRGPRAGGGPPFPPGPPPRSVGGPGGLFPPMHWVPFVFLFVTTLLASAFSALILIFFLRKQSNYAHQVITDLKNGNLKARFPKSNFKDVNNLTESFNSMADEIERLVSHLRARELKRTAVLEELAHDLRTPIGSLKNLIQTLHDSLDLMPAGTKEELFNLAEGEIDYFGKLVEDLLFWAQLMEPDTRLKKQTFNLKNLIWEELEKLKVSYPQININLDFQGSEEVAADIHLLRRLIRNAVDNAFSHARTAVNFSIKNQDGYLDFSIKDDGPGLSPSALSSFGSKRSVRWIDPLKPGRISVGLGSMIIIAIAQVYSGFVKIENTMDSQGIILGANLKIRLGLPS